MIRKDDRAQWILLSAVVIAIGMGSLIFLLNTAMMTGSSSSHSVMSVPKDKIRDLRYQAVTQAMIIGRDANHNASASNAMVEFNRSYDRFVDETEDLYLNHGIIVNVSYLPTYDQSLNKVRNVSLTILFNDGITIYTENASVGIEE